MNVLLDGTQSNDGNKHHHHQAREGDEKEADRLAAISGDASESKNPTDRLRSVGMRCVVVILAYVMVGWLFFGLKYGWTFIDCFYFAMVTVTTVGYGDLLPLPTFQDQIFTACYALLGVGFIGFVIAEFSTIIGYMIKDLERRVRKASVKSASKTIARQAQATSEKAPFSKRNSLQDFIEDLLTETEEEEAERGTWQWYARGIIVNAMSCISCWTLGAVILIVAEGFKFTDGFYCAAITSLSVGYGDFYPQTTIGRLLYAFYIPVSVVWILACIGSLTMRLSQLQITEKKFTEPLSSLMSMDVDGSGSISKEEYIVYMILAMREVDLQLVTDLSSQFKLMDTDDSGSLELGDFPPGLALERTANYAGGILSSVDLKVVPGGDGSGQHLVGKARDAEVARRLREFRTSRSMNSLNLRKNSGELTALAMVGNGFEGVKSMLRVGVTKQQQPSTAEIILARGAVFGEHEPHSPLHPPNEVELMSVNLADRSTALQQQDKRILI